MSYDNEKFRRQIQEYDRQNYRQAKLQKIIDNPSEFPLIPRRNTRKGSKPKFIDKLNAKISKERYDYLDKRSRRINIVALITIVYVMFGAMWADLMSYEIHFSLNTNEVNEIMLSFQDITLMNEMGSYFVKGVNSAFGLLKIVADFMQYILDFINSLVAFFSSNWLWNWWPFGPILPWGL